MSNPFRRAEWLELIALASRDARNNGQRLTSEDIAWLRADYLRSYDAGQENHLSQPRLAHPRWAPSWLSGLLAKAKAIASS